MRISNLFLCVAAVSCCTAFADNEATTSAAASKTAATIIPANDGKWHTVLTTVIKNPTATDDLFLDVSQVNRVTTTNVSSSATPNVISSGDAKLMLRVLVDGNVALPGPVRVGRAAHRADLELTKVSIAKLHPDNSAECDRHGVVRLHCISAPRRLLRPAAGFPTGRLHNANLHNPNVT